MALSAVCKLYRFACGTNEEWAYAQVSFGVLCGKGKLFLKTVFNVYGFKKGYAVSVELF